MKRRFMLKILSSLPLFKFVRLDFKKIEDIYTKKIASDVLSFPLPPIIAGEEINITIISDVPILPLPLPMKWSLYRDDYIDFNQYYQKVYYKSFTKNTVGNIVSIKLKSKTKNVIVQIDKIIWRTYKDFYGVKLKYKNLVHCGIYWIGGKLG